MSKEAAQPLLFLGGAPQKNDDRMAATPAASPAKKAQEFFGEMSSKALGMVAAAGEMRNRASEKASTAVAAVEGVRSKIAITAKQRVNAAKDAVAVGSDIVQQRVDAAKELLGQRVPCQHGAYPAESESESNMQKLLAMGFTRAEATRALAVFDDAGVATNMLCDRRASAASESTFAKVKAAELKVFFKPGPVGVYIDRTDVVTTVDEQKQAHRLGIRDGMHFLTVKGKPYTPARYVAARAGTESYEVTFAQATRSTPAEATRKKNEPVNRALFKELAHGFEEADLQQALIVTMKDAARSELENLWEVVVTSASSFEVMSQVAAQPWQLRPSVGTWLALVHTDDDDEQENKKKALSMLDEAAASSKSSASRFSPVRGGA